MRQWPDRGGAPGPPRAAVPALTGRGKEGRDGPREDRTVVVRLSSRNDEERRGGGASCVPSIPARSRAAARDGVPLAVPPCQSQCVGSGECRAERCALAPRRGVRAIVEESLGRADRAGTGQTVYTFRLSQKLRAGGGAPHPPRSAGAAATLCSRGDLCHFGRSPSVRPPRPWVAAVPPPRPPAATSPCRGCSWGTALEHSWGVPERDRSSSLRGPLLWRAPFFPLLGAGGRPGGSSSQFRLTRTPRVVEVGSQKRCIFTERRDGRRSADRRSDRLR